MRIIDFLLRGIRKRKREAQYRRDEEQRYIDNLRSLRQQAIESDRELLKTDKEILEILKEMTTTLEEQQKKEEDESE